MASLIPRIEQALVVALIPRKRWSHVSPESTRKPFRLGQCCRAAAAAGSVLAAMPV